MLEVYRNNDEVVIAVDIGLAHNCQGDIEAKIEFSWCCGQPYLADALARHISKVMREAIADACGEAYRRGWADARAKRAKRETFQDWL